LAQECGNLPSIENGGRRIVNLLEISEGGGIISKAELDSSKPFA
jgi:hypothetical protein